MSILCTSAPRYTVPLHIVVFRLFKSGEGHRLAVLIFNIYIVKLAFKALPKGLYILLTEVFLLYLFLFAQALLLAFFIQFIYSFYHLVHGNRLLFGL